MTKDTDLLLAAKNGSHRKNMGSRLRKIIAKNEKQLHGFVGCFCCGTAVAARSSTIEHILPVSLGGKTVIENLALSHRLCNEQRGNIPTRRFITGVTK